MAPLAPLVASRGRAAGPSRARSNRRGGAFASDPGLLTGARGGTPVCLDRAGSADAAGRAPDVFFVFF